MNIVNEAARIADDDYLRSNYVRELVRGPVPSLNPVNFGAIPKTIIQFWHDSERIPADVRKCLESWKPFTKQGFEILLFDDDTAKQFIGEEFGEEQASAFDRCPHPAMRCDYFRLCYIFKYGGFYIDADEVYQNTDCSTLFSDTNLKLNPLCYDNSSGAMVDANAFVRGRASSSAWTFYVNNNPIIAPARHPLIRSALSSATQQILRLKNEKIDIQAMTGPGNLTRSLVKHFVTLEFLNSSRDFAILQNWDEISVSRWTLSYRSDNRNWRLWNTESFK